MYKRFWVHSLVQISPAARWMLSAGLLIILSTLWYRYGYVPLQGASTFYRSHNTLLIDQKKALELRVIRSQELVRRDAQLFAILKKKCKSASRKLELQVKHIERALKKNGLILLSSEQLRKQEFSNWMLTTYEYRLRGTFDQHAAFLAALSAQKVVFCTKAVYAKGEGALIATCLFCCVEKA